MIKNIFLWSVAILLLLFVASAAAGFFIRPSQEMTFSAELARRDGAPIEYASIIEWHKMSLNQDEKDCLDKEVYFYDNVMPKHLTEMQVKEMRANMRRYGLTPEEGRRKLIAIMATKHCYELR